MQDQTKEYTETHYYKRKDETLLFEINHFWADLAKYFVQKPEQRGPFLTNTFTECYTSGREAFLVQCFMDLSFQ